MPRKPRNIRADGTYHVTQRGNNREAVFLESADYYHYLRILAEARKKFPFELHHYALMPNHIHLILRSTSSHTLSPIMRMVAQTYARRFNAVYKKTGHLWGDRFFSKEITNDEYLLTAGIYVELNPVRAGIVTDPRTYPWSSHAAYALATPNPLITHSPAYLGLHRDIGRRITEYSALANRDSHSPVP